MFKDSGSNRRTNATVSFQKQTIAMGSHSYFTFTMSYQLFKVSACQWRSKDTFEPLMVMLAILIAV